MESQFRWPDRGPPPERRIVPLAQEHCDTNEMSGRRLPFHETEVEQLVAPCNPWLHIAEEIASEAQTRGYKRVGLLGTMFMMEGSVYPSQLRRYGIDSHIPEAVERRRLNRFIFDEMVHGEFSVEAREQALDLLQAMHTQGCDAVGLCCTELPLLLKGAESPLPLLDSTTILAHAALKVLEGKKPLATAVLNRAPGHAR